MTQPTRKELEKRVERGIQWLDENKPEWLDRIKPDHLDMINCDRCILGQIFGHYNTPLVWGKIKSKEAKECGFAIYHRSYPTFQAVKMQYNRLTEIWLDKIRELKSQRKQQNNGKGKEVKREYTRTETPTGVGNKRNREERREDVEEVQPVPVG